MGLEIAHANHGMYPLNPVDDLRDAEVGCGAEVRERCRRIHPETGHEQGDRGAEVEALRVETMDAVNEYFHKRLIALPEIAEYLDKIAASGEQH